MSLRIAIAPLTIVGDQLQLIAESVQDLLLREVGLSQNFTVISKQSTELAFQRSDDIYEIGHQLDILGIIQGSISEKNGYQVILTYSRLDKKETKEKVFLLAKNDIFKLGESCLKAVLEFLQLKESSQHSKPVAKLMNPKLHQKFLLGDYHFNRWTQDNVAEAISLFEEVIVAQPNFAPVYLKLAKCYIFQAGRGHQWPNTVYPLAREAIKKALALNPTSGEAIIHSNLIDFFFDLDWRNVYSSIEIGLKNYVDASEAYQQLSFFWYGLKKYDAALDALYSALEFDPLSTGILNMIGDVQLSAKRYDDSEKTFLSILKMVPNDAASLENLMYLASLRGNENLASRYLRKLEKALPESSPYVPRMGYFYGRFNLQKEASNYLEHFERLEAEQKNRVFHNYKSQVYAGSGDWERVMDCIEKGWKARTGILYILTDPQLEPLHNWKRYQTIIGQVRFPKNIAEVDYVTLHTDIKEKVRINLSSLLFAKAEDNYTRLYFFQNFRIEEKLLRATLKTVASQLPEHFLRVHRTYLFNTAKPFKVFGNSKTRYILQSQHNFEIPVSRSFDLSILNPS